MDRDEFWQRIEDCSEARGSAEDFEELLREKLSDLDGEELLAFDHEFRALRYEAYDWGLWGAAFVVQGGCSDDSFEYFRTWLVCQGQEAYEGALADPDSLAELLAEVEDAPELTSSFESVAYVASDIWAERNAGKEMPVPELDVPEEPSGEEFEEDSSLLRNRYPQLWDQFGGDEIDDFGEDEG